MVSLWSCCQASDEVACDLTTVDRLCRVIVRDPSGKHCWDSVVLYGPTNCRSGSYPAGREPHSDTVIHSCLFIICTTLRNMHTNHCDICYLTHARTHTHTQTDTLITILTLPYRGQSNYPTEIRKCVCMHTGKGVFASSAVGAGCGWRTELYIWPRSIKHRFDMAEYQLRLPLKHDVKLRDVENLMNFV